MSKMRLPVTVRGFFWAQDIRYDALHNHKGCYYVFDDHLYRFEHAVAECQYRSVQAVQGSQTF
jgi:hypothetical protein